MCAAQCEDDKIQNSGGLERLVMLTIISPVRLCSVTKLFYCNTLCINDVIVLHSISVQMVSFANSRLCDGFTQRRMSAK